jgi:hypothetical protein
MHQCKSIGCGVVITSNTDKDYCKDCETFTIEFMDKRAPLSTEPSMSELYPKYYKDFSGDNEADVYLVHHRFELQDFSGALHHSSKKILLSGVRTGGKTQYMDIKEARDTLNRWLQINKPAEE